jgi:hypothetical protein
VKNINGVIVIVSWYAPTEKNAPAWFSIGIVLLYQKQGL